MIIITRYYYGNLTGKAYVDFLSEDFKYKALSNGNKKWALYTGNKRRRLTKRIDKVMKFIYTGDWF